MMGLDSYLSSTRKNEPQERAIHSIQPRKTLHPLLCWDILGMHLQQSLNNARKLQELQHLEKLASKFHWKTNLKSILSNDYYALVLTDVASTIQWVNKDFTAMTGYSEKSAIGKSPVFLQGKNTSAISRKKIKEHLTLQLPFQESIVNYRKNNEEYVCQVSIFPIHGILNDVTHFLALEKEVILV